MSATETPLERLVDVLRAAGQEPTAEDIADVLWLAARLPIRETSVQPEPPAPQPSPPSVAAGTPRESVPPSRAEHFGPPATGAGAASAAPATTELYPAQAGLAGGEGGAPARNIRSPGAAALPGSLELGRSLRPLKRRVPSRAQLVLDETATAHRIADTGEWMPVLRSAPERWLDIVLVVEESSSMIIWQRTLAELTRLLERQGAFRNIEVLGFGATSDFRSVDLYTGIGPRSGRRRSRRPSEIVDPLGRRLIAVVSDCVSAVWHNGCMAALLNRWGRVGMTTVVQVLPPDLWVRTGLRTFPRTFVRSPTPGAPNSTFDVEFTGYRPRPGPPYHGVPVPIVSLEALSLDYWARAMAGNSNLWIPGVFAVPAATEQASPAPPPDATTLQTAAPSPEQLVRVFYGTASPTARRLASVLAAVPLTLPVIRLVQRALLPESRQVHLAEFWLSGLIDRPPTLDHATPADNVEYLFVRGVRELLLTNLRLGEVIEVLSAVSTYVGERLGQPLDFSALIADPTATGDLQIAQGYRSFARVAAGALRRFGGSYTELARRLEISLYGETVRPVDLISEVPVPIQAGSPRTGNAVRTKEDVRVAALLVGVDEHAASEIPPLLGSRNDVYLTKGWLQDRFGVSADDIVTLVDRQATRQAIIDAWRGCASRLEAGDQFFFHFSGNDLQLPSSDTNAADGLDETLLAYDSIPADRSTLLAHQDLADLAAEVEARGAQAILFLDSCRTATGVFARRALPNTLLFASSAENEISREILSEGKNFGVATSSLAEAMEALRPGMTWLDAYDRVLASVIGGGYQQTPQLIGLGDLAIFGAARKPVPPYLVVTKANEREIEVHAPAALFQLTDSPAPRLAIYEPGSTMTESPIGFARVTRLTVTGVGAALESPITVSVASRVRPVDDDVAPPILTVAVGKELGERMSIGALFDIKPLGSNDCDLVASVEDSTLALRDRQGMEVWHEDVDADSGIDTQAARLHGLLQHLCKWLRTAVLENPRADTDLAGQVDLELLAPDSMEEVTLAGGQPLTLRMKNHSEANLYVSVWMLDEFLGVEQVYPATTSCVLLGKEREVTLAVAVRPNDKSDRPTRLTFKVFASRQPNDLGLLALQRFNRPFELTNLVRGRLPIPREATE